jgi:hypothetical protein
MAREALDPQQAIATGRKLSETLGVPEVTIAAQHQRQTRPDDSVLKPDDIPIER